MLLELIEDLATSNFIDRWGRHVRLIAALVCIALLAWGAVAFFMNG